MNRPVVRRNGRGAAVLLLSAAASTTSSAVPARGSPGVETAARTMIMCAYRPECEALLPDLRDQMREERAGVSFVVGNLEQRPVVLVESGVSMVNASVAAQLALDRFRTRSLVVLGISGSANPRLHVGDVVVPARWTQSLESVFARRDGPGFRLPSYYAVPQRTHFGMIFPQPVRVPRGSGEPEQRRWFPTSASMLAGMRRIAGAVKLAACSAPGTCLSRAPVLIVGGVGASGPAFVDNADFRRFARRAFQADVLDMEAGAVAQVAYMNRVPFVSIRSVSDLAGGSAAVNEMQAFQDLASRNAAAVLKAFLRTEPSARSRAGPNGAGPAR